MLAVLTTIDYGVLGLYFLAMVGVGVYFRPIQRTTQDFFWGERSLGWFPLGLSLMATLVSTTGYTGLPGESYEFGIRTLLIPLSAWLVLPILVGVVLPIYRGLGLASIYEYLEYRFDSRTRLAGSFIFVVWRLLWLGALIHLSCRILIQASGLAMPTWPLILLVGTVTTLYTFLGGMKGVVWTTVIQGVVMLAGVLVMVLSLWWGLNHGPARVTEVADNLLRFEPADFQWSWSNAWCFWGALPHWFLVTLTFYMADQNTAQRFLSAKSVNAARTSFLASCIALSLLQIGLIYLGLCLLVFYQDHPKNMRPDWVTSLDSKTREVAQDEKGQPLLDPQHNPSHEVTAENLHELVKEGRILRPNSREPFTSTDADSLLDVDTGKVDPTKLLMRRPPSGKSTGEIIVRQGAPSEMLPHFVANQLPWGAAGLVLVALLAAGMASISSSLNSIAALLVVDFHRRFGWGKNWLATRLQKSSDQLTPADEMQIAQPLTLIVGMGATLMALAFSQLSDVLGSMMTIANTVGAPLLGVFLLGIFTRRATAAGALAALILGIAATVCFAVLGLLRENERVDAAAWPVSEIWTVTFGVTFTFAFGFIASLILGRRKTKTQLRGLVAGVGNLGVLAADEETPHIGDPTTVEIGTRWK